MRDLPHLFAFPVLLVLASSLAAEGLKNRIPKNQKPILNVFPPSAAERSKPGVGKFVIFTREQVGKEGDFIAGAWECNPSLPETPITKRVEFCHSSWNCNQLLDVLVADDSYGMHPRFARLQVDSGDRDYTVNLYDINYRTWEVRCLWQGSQLLAFGVMGDSIFSGTSDGWLLINTVSGKLSTNLPFTPVATDGNYWLVRKTGEVERDGCWSYDRRKGRYVAHFGPVAEPDIGFSQAKLSPDGKTRAWVLAPAPPAWRGGALAGRLVLQRDGKKEDISVPIELMAGAGSGVPVIPDGVQLTFLPKGKFQLRTRKEHNDRVWTIDIATGKVHSDVRPHLAPKQDSYAAALGGVPVPDYLKRYGSLFSHFGRSGLAPAFLLHLRILKKEPEYFNCWAGVSRDGRHVLYRATKGALSDVYIYGDLQTKRTVRWKAPENLGAGDAQDFVWVETPR